MTQILLNAKAHGQTAATPVTGANSAYLGTQASAVTLVSPGTVTFEGTDVIRFTDEGGSSVARVDYNAILNGSTVFSFEVEFAAVAAPVGGEMRVLSVRDVANALDLVRVQILTDRTVRIYDGNGTSKWTSTTALPTAAGSRLYVGGTLSTGTVNVGIYTASDGRSTTVAESSGALTGFAWGGATTVGGARIGCITTTPTQTWDLRNFRLDDTTASALGPLGGVVLKGTMSMTMAMPSPSAFSEVTVTGGGPMAMTWSMPAPSASAGGSGVGGGGTGGLAVTATLAGPGTQPRVVLVDVTGLTVGDDYVLTASSGTWSRAVQGGTGEATSTQLVLTDAATPLNCPITYTVVSDSGTASSSPVTVTYDAGDAVLCSLDGDTVAGVFWLDTGDERAQSPRVAFFDVSGRSRRVMHYDVAADESGTMVVETDGADTVALRELVRRGAPVLLRTNLGIRDLDPVEVLGIAGAPRRLVGVSSRRRWDLSYVLTDDPSTSPLVTSTIADFNTVEAGLSFSAFNSAWSGQSFADFNAFDWAGEV